MDFHVFKHAGMKLHYSTTGRGDPLVFIHGLSGSTAWWRYNTAVFSLHYQVYQLDLVGFGQGRRQRALGVAGDVELIGAWMIALNLHNVTLIGHSMGGQVALRLAERHPKRVSNLVLACASGLLRGKVIRMALRLPGAAWRGRPSFVPRIAFDSVRAGLPNLWRSGNSLLADDTWPSLNLIKVRTLVIWGERDPLIPTSLGRALAAGIPGAQYIEIPRAGHVVMVDAPVAFNRVVLAFLHDRPVDEPVRPY